MLLGTVLVVYVSLENAAAPELAPLKAAASEFLGDGSEVRVVSSSELSDREAIDQAPGADGIVELRWSLDRSSVLLRCYTADEGAWVDRRIGFSADDDPVERGRFLGLAVASTLRRTPVAPPLAERPSEPTGRPRRDEPVAVPARVSRGPTLQFGATTQRDLELRFWEAGAVVMVRVPMLASVSMQLGLAGSVGQLPSADVTARALDLGLGVVWDALPAGGRVGVAARLGAWAGLGDLSRPLAQGPAERRQLWRAQGDALGEVSYRFGESVSLYGAAGLGLSFSRAVVYVRDREVAVLQPVRLKAELGLKTKF